jgi:peptidoglycan hydrolase CwlO-like protein
MEKLFEWIPTILALGAGAILFQQRNNTEKAKLASSEYQDVSKLVQEYVADLRKLSKEVENLHEDIAAARKENLELRVENERLLREISELRLELERLRNTLSNG